jgi:anti-sigma factor RsiW
MDNRHLDDVYELYLLGSLSAEEAARISEHLERGCPHCLAHLSDAARTVYALILLQPKAGGETSVATPIPRHNRKQ